MRHNDPDGPFFYPPMPLVWRPPPPPSAPKGGYQDAVQVLLEGARGGACPKPPPLEGRQRSN